MELSIGSKRQSAWLGQRGATLMLAMALVLSLAFVGLYAMSRALNGFYRAVNLERRTQATYLAEAGVQLGLQSLDAAGPLAGLTLPFALLPATAVGEGSCSAILMNNPGDPGGTRDTDGVVVIRSTGTAQGEHNHRVLEATVFVSTAGFPPVPGVLVIGAGSNAALGGNATIDGRDALISGSAVAGVAIETPGQTLHQTGSINVHGNPDYEWGSSLFTNGDGFSNTVQWIIDRVSTLPSAVHVSGHVPNKIGTSAAPQITVIDAGSSASMTGKCTGVGILVVQGTLKLAGQFSFEGLILVDGDANLQKTTGTVDLFGAMVMTPPEVAGKDAVVQVGGSSRLIYSQTAINVAGSLVPALAVRSYLFRN